MAAGAQSTKDNSLKFAHGTTTLAFVFDHGVIVAVDSRSSMGPYIASATVKKCIEINPYLVSLPWSLGRRPVPA